MIFVPSEGGVSHHESEHTEPADLVAGARVLAETLRSLVLA
jgi:N-carbamoyl-L-amino-acid hydrolase